MDVEFQNDEDKNMFKMPDYCLVESTPDAVLSGGMLSGKKYSDIEETLKRYNYTKII